MRLKLFFQKIESYLFGVRLHSYKSALHGSLEVWLINGKLVLNSTNANQSYDSLHEVFRYCFHYLKIDEQPIHHVLLLGLGVGSVPAIIEEELMMNCKVTAVEFDPVMLELGRKYFNIRRFKKLRIVEQDASLFIKNIHESFELVIIDLFVDDMVPDAVAEESFLNDLIRLTEPEGYVLFNLIIKNKLQEEQLRQISDFFRKQNGTLKILSPLGNNKVVCWQKGLQ